MGIAKQQSQDAVSASAAVGKPSKASVQKRGLRRKPNSEDIVNMKKLKIGAIDDFKQSIFTKDVDFIGITSFADIKAI